MKQWLLKLGQAVRYNPRDCHVVPPRNAVGFSLPSFTRTLRKPHHLIYFQNLTQLKGSKYSTLKKKLKIKSFFNN
jgi:hypothetical protein